MVFTQNAGPTRLSATGQVISAGSLAWFTASVARLAGRSGPGSRALQTAAVAGLVRMGATEVFARTVGQMDVLLSG